MSRMQLTSMTVYFFSDCFERLVFGSGLLKSVFVYTASLRTLQIKLAVNAARSGVLDDEFAAGLLGLVPAYLPRSYSLQCVRPWVHSALFVAIFQYR